MTGLVQGLSAEFASMLLVVLVGGFTLIGGLGATFYVSNSSSQHKCSIVVKVLNSPYRLLLLV